MKRSGILVALVLWASPAGADVYKDKDGKDVITYAANVPPKRQPGSRLALLVGFHGRGGNEKQLIDGAVGALQKAGIREEYVIVGLKSKEDGWTDKDDAAVEQFLPWAIKNWSIDPRRVYGVGFSSGAYYLNKFVPNHSGLFAGAITYVGGQGGLAKTADPESKSELYWIVGQADQTVKAESVRPNMQAAKAAGYRFVYREIAGMGHEVYRDPPLADAIQWMTSLRSKEAPLSAEEQAVVDKFADAAKGAERLSDAAAMRKVAAIGGPAVASIILQSLSADREGTRLQGIRACSVMMFDGAVVEKLASLVDDKDGSNRLKAIQALTFQGRWNYGAAQDAVCRVARDGKRPASERNTAVVGLGEIVRIDLLGGFQFKNVIWTLVDLLDDDEAGVRGQASLILQPVSAGLQFAPGSGKAAREGPMIKWRAWAEKICGPKP